MFRFKYVLKNSINYFLLVGNQNLLLKNYLVHDIFEHNSTPLLLMKKLSEIPRLALNSFFETHEFEQYFQKVL